MASMTISAVYERVIVGEGTIYVKYPEKGSQVVFNNKGNIFVIYYRSDFVRDSLTTKQREIDKAEQLGYHAHPKAIALFLDGKYDNLVMQKNNKKKKK